MKEALGFVLLASLAVLVASHVAIAIGLGRSRMWLRVGLVLVVPPLAPWWAWELGMRRRMIAWTTALVVYAVAVAAA